MAYRFKIMYVTLFKDCISLEINKIQKIIQQNSVSPEACLVIRFATCDPRCLAQNISGMLLIMSLYILNK